MNRQIALAYGVAAIATSIAFATLVGSTLGWSEPAQDPVVAPLASAAPVVTVPEPPQAPDEPEIVYVDETGAPLADRPVRRSRHDEHERWEHERDDDDRWEHERDDDDRWERDDD